MNSFKEVQRFNQWWLVLLSIILILGFIYVYFFTIEGHTEKARLFGYAYILGSILFSLLFFSIRLQTEITQDKIAAKFSFFSISHPWNSIKSVRVINYGFVGGWGIRFSIKYGTIYNVKGKHGLEIIMLNGKKLIIGTQKKEEMQAFIEKLATQDAHIASLVSFH